MKENILLNYSLCNCINFLKINYSFEINDLINKYYLTNNNITIGRTYLNKNMKINLE